MEQNNDHGQGKSVAVVGGYWDEQPGVEPGWYLMTKDADGNILDDSQKIWFPIQVDDFGQGQRKELVAAVRQAFPGAEVRIDWTGTI